MVDDLCDLRCDTFKYGVHKFGRKITPRDNVFITPHFLKHFDFFGGYEEKILECKINFASI